MNRTNVLALADVIERGFPDLTFDMCTMYDGRSGCLVGHFHRWTWGENAPRISPDDERQQDAAIGAMARWLGLEADYRLKLLIRDRDAEREDAARTLRTLAWTGEVYWPRHQVLNLPRPTPVPLLAN